MLEKLPPLSYYKWHWQSWRANRKVQRMTYIERGLYRELLDECWSEGFIPNNIESMAEICGCPVDVMESAWQVLSTCFVLLDGVFVNERMDRERTEKDFERAKRARAGKVGGLHKSLKLEEKLASAKHLPSKCHIEEKRREEKRREKTTLSAHADVVVSVFDHWRDRMGHPAAKLDDKRRRLITSALNIGYTPENLFAAIDGCALSPHHMGQNDRSTRYDSLDLIFRSADKIDWFIAMTEQNPGFIEKHTDRSWRDGVDGQQAEENRPVSRDQDVVVTVAGVESNSAENAKQGAL